MIAGGELHVAGVGVVRFGWVELFQFSLQQFDRFVQVIRILAAADDVDIVPEDRQKLCGSFRRRSVMSYLRYDSASL